MTKVFLPALMLALAVGGVSAQDAPYANSDDANTRYGWADVLRVDPIYGVSRDEVPRQGCGSSLDVLPVITRQDGLRVAHFVTFLQPTA